MAKIAIDFGEQALVVSGDNRPKGNLQERIKQATSGKEVLALLLDYSGSMELPFDSGMTRMQAAHFCVEKFANSLDPRKTLLGLIGFSFEANLFASPTTNFPTVVAAAKLLFPSSSTQMDKAIDKALDIDNLSRMILTSDGSPDSTTSTDAAVQRAVERKIPIDCIFIGEMEDRGAHYMRSIAERTGGFFFSVDDLKGFQEAVLKLETEARLQLVDLRDQK